jgi:tetratricopeptide (TPR) repeat protein
MARIEGLPDDHHSKPQCLFELSQLFQLAGNGAEQKRTLAQVLLIERGRQNHSRVALALMCLSGANRLLDLREEGIQQAKEALGIYERLGDTAGQARCLNRLAYLLDHDDQLDAAEEAATRAIKLLPEKGQEYIVCESHRILGTIHESKGEREKSIHHYEAALGIASPFNWHDELFGIISHWHRCFPMKTGSTMHTPTSDEPSYTPATTHTTWVARSCCRLRFGVNSTGSTR